MIDRIIDEGNEQEPVRHLFPGDDLFTSIERRRGLLRESDQPVLRECLSQLFKTRVGADFLGFRVLPDRLRFRAENLSRAVAAGGIRRNITAAS
ncbi:MAG: hypothetical protein SF339_05695 [Blastocatellia bacterium]|nr:hypothetical protein [Blastocatellia bacterium]